ncbi:MAG: hypothetical protein VXW65_02010 [Pseudomonadota bacterium]|nr:hypothetical protein [Pseudomonadota bacterium]
MLWTIPADWSTPIIERLEFKTDVMLAYNGAEQRIALRQTPRRWLEFAYLIDGAHARRAFEAKLWSHGAQAWQLPIWTDATAATAAISNGATVIALDAQYRDFVAGGHAALIDGERHLVVEIVSVAADQIVVNPIAGDWPIETTVVPVRSAYLEPQQQVTRFTGDAVYNVARFMLDDVSEYPAAAPEVLYRSEPVLTMPSNWMDDITVDYQRKMSVVDFQIGGMYRDDETGQPVLVQSHHWVLASRAQISAFRGWLYAQRGRFKGIWLPSFLPDFDLVAPVTDSSLQINVGNHGYTDLYQIDKNRRDLRIELSGGIILYRRITASTVIDPQTEQITLDTALGVAVAPADIERISLMSYCRLDTDAIELAWSWGDYVDVRANWRTTNDDV